MNLHQDVFGDDTTSDEDQPASPGGGGRGGGKSSDDAGSGDDEAAAAAAAAAGTTQKRAQLAVAGLDSTDDDEQEEGAQPSRRRIEDDEPGREDGSPKRAGDGRDLFSTGGLSDEDEDGRAPRDGSGAAREQAFATGPPLRLEAPLLPPFQSNEVHMMRTSNILNIELRPWDPYAFRAEEEDNFDAGTAAKHTNVVRWRYVKDKHGQRVPESNARMVRWDDGSWTMMLGDEALDATHQDITANQQFLYVRHQGDGPGQGIIQGQSKLVSRMGFQPSSLKSKSHLQLKAAMELKHKGSDRRAQKMAVVNNPEKELEERSKAIEMRIKDRETLKSKQDKSMRRFGGGGGGTSSSHFGSGAPSRLSRDFVDADDDDDGDFGDDDGLTPSQRARAALGRGDRDYRGFTEEDETEAERRILNAKKDTQGGGSARKRKKAYESEEEESEAEESGDEEAAEGEPDSDEDDKKQQRKKQVVMSSDDDDEE